MVDTQVRLQKLGERAMGHVVIIDGQNFMYRARAGFQGGELSVVINFFRNLRALVELLKPTRLIYVLEGHPQKRCELLPSYKENRKIKADDPKAEKKLREREDFFRQAKMAVDLLAEHFPVSVVRNERFECDDTIYNIIKSGSTACNVTVVSNDTDFTQLLNEFDHVSIYNPMAKEYVKKPDYCYVTWKSLRGDGTDNIPGIPGIGNKIATAIVNDPDKLKKLFEDKTKADQFTLNYKLIKLYEWDDIESVDMTSTISTRDWDAVKAQFDEWGFKSITKEPTWNKFVSTFDVMFSQELSRYL